MEEIETLLSCYTPDTSQLYVRMDMPLTNDARIMSPHSMLGILLMPAR